MNFKVRIENVQHIKAMEFKVDLSSNKIICLTGKNSVGKTTLTRAIRNLSINNTFQETAAPYIFNNTSSVKYYIDDIYIKFVYNSKLKTIDTRQEINDLIRKLAVVELPIPYGDRFNHFRKLSDIDSEIRSEIALGHYTIPTELIRFLNQVYQNDRFLNLKQLVVKGDVYYFILKDETERFYIREDYLSSGEYFVISLFKHIQKRNKFIVIDEIDISLDASAQVNLIKCLRQFCSEYAVNIIFTTHSLAVMKTLCDDELYYMASNDEAVVTIKNTSYNFVKSIMYGFNGYDRYILTEDKCLVDFMNYLLRENDKTTFFKYQIIPIAGGTQVIDLMRKNSETPFLVENENHIISVLDGDQLNEKYHQDLSNVFFLPFSSVEKEVYQGYLDNDPKLPRVVRVDGGNFSKKAKNYYHQIICIYNSKQLMTEYQVYNYLCSKFPSETSDLKDILVRFLNG
ncbi:AAA family ATPase [Shewanella ulleungensis]|uniref:AAA+ ATPase domain-containing protein n=1 Tax=Shewanella ulleungensis TaxID=2282699 RepID=A0ABQ2QIY7_9GAMM|nr:AAA family ATPase [Shewanella ulleungensis]MCL1149811.1 AAA family ATPase [Shewanella ulleungensis]GGP81505.1 hypothetical protein GCM10009410_13150 [Shewanella ulleungensis]